MPLPNSLSPGWLLRLSELEATALYSSKRSLTSRFLEALSALFFKVPPPFSSFLIEFRTKTSLETRKKLELALPGLFCSPGLAYKKKKALKLVCGRRLFRLIYPINPTSPLE